MRVAIAFGLTAVLAGCQTTGQNDPKSAALMAVPPNYKTLIVNHYRETLKDPYSIRSAGITPPREDFTGLLNGGTRPAVCVRFNAKNSFGAYVGLRSAVVWFNDGKLAGALEEGLGCRDVSFGPFPELENIDSRAN